MTLLFPGNHTSSCTLQEFNLQIANVLQPSKFRNYGCLRHNGVARVQTA